MKGCQVNTNFKLLTYSNSHLEGETQKKHAVGSVAGNLRLNYSFGNEFMAETKIIKFISK